MKRRTSPKLALAAQRVNQCSKCGCHQGTSQAWSSGTNHGVSKQRDAPLTVEDDTTCRSARCFQSSLSRSIPKRWCPPRWTVGIGSVRTLSSIPWCWIWGCTLLSPSRKCLLLLWLAAKWWPLPALRTETTEVGRCRWWCTSGGKPRNVVDRVLHSGVVKSGERSAWAHARFLMRGCASLC